MLVEFLSLYVGDSEGVVLWEDRGGARRQITPWCCPPLALMELLYDCDPAVRGLISPRPGMAGMDAVNILVDFGDGASGARAALAGLWRGEPRAFYDASRGEPRRNVIVRESVYSSAGGPPLAEGSHQNETTFQ